MVTPLDEKLVPKVLALIDKIGVTGTFKDMTTKTFDATTNKTTIVENDVSRKTSPPVPYDAGWRPSSTVVGATSVTYVAGSGLTFTPEEGMYIVIGGEKWEVVKANPIYSGDQIAAWELHVRK